MADSQKKVLALVDNAVKNAPAGTESAVALVKSAVPPPTTPTKACTRLPSRPPKSPKPTSPPMTNTAVKATKQATAGKGKRAPPDRSRDEVDAPRRPTFCSGRASGLNFLRRTFSTQLPGIRSPGLSCGRFLLGTLGVLFRPGLMTGPLFLCARDSGHG
jgi:hypothetical protein